VVAVDHPTDQSSCPVALSRLSSSRSADPILRPPASRAARRHAVTPEQPISSGTNRQGRPVSGTKRIAVNATRSSTRGRPIRRAGRSGNSGSNTPQSPSPTSSNSAIRHLSFDAYVLRATAGPASPPARDGLLKPLLRAQRFLATKTRKSSSGVGSCSLWSPWTTTSTNPARSSITSSSFLKYRFIVIACSSSAASSPSFHM
jgi:hypothetical protein